MDEIKIGTVLTEYSFGDKYPYEVVKVVNQNYIYVKELELEKKDKLLTPSFDTPIYELQKKDGDWYWVRRKLKINFKNLPKWPQTLKSSGEGDEKIDFTKTDIKFGIAEYYVE